MKLVDDQIIKHNCVSTDSVSSHRADSKIVFKFIATCNNSDCVKILILIIS